jgi:hypothetical protein
MPGAFFNYGWATEDSGRLPAFKNGYSRYSLTMQNHFGGQCYETFFLVVPEGIAITSQSEDYTNKGNANGWDIYWWKKEVPANTDHTVNVTLSDKTNKTLKLEAAPWVDGETLRYDLNTMFGAKIGEIIYTVENLLRTDNNDICRIESYMNVAANNMQQFTQVDARIDNMTPIFGRTKNQLGDFEANYLPNKINLTTKISSKSQVKEFTPYETVYDNEEALYLIRRMPLAENYIGKFNIFPVQSGAICQCEIKVTGKEQITVPAGTFDCFKVELTVFANGIKALQHNVWVSADKNKYMVKYDSGQTIMELSHIGFTTNAPNETIQEGVSFKLPAGWYSMINQREGGYKFSIQIISPQIENWAVLTAAEGEGLSSLFSSPKQAAQGDIGVLKGFFKNYTVRENSWKDLTIDATPAASYEADYEDNNIAMVEYRTYILGKSTIYWFVFRVEKNKFDEIKAELDSIINSFRTSEK